MEVISTTLGFPRIGERRQLKFALEKFWKGKITETELIDVAQKVEENNWDLQAKHASKIGVGFFSLYDHVLDWTVRLGCESQRFKKVSAGLKRYFTMARGADGIPAMDMTKWFDTNYHYEVPEIDSTTTPQANFGDLMNTMQRAITHLGVERVSPIILGPVTYASLCHFNDAIDFSTFVAKLLPIYKEIILQLKALGLKDVQIHEPALVTSTATTHEKLYKEIYGDKSSSLMGTLTILGLPIHIVTYFDDLHDSIYKWIVQSEVQAVTLDFTRGNNIQHLRNYGFSASKILGAGIIDGRSIWKFHPITLKPLLDEIIDILGKNANANAKLSIQPSCSLQHVPYTVSYEKRILEDEKSGLKIVMSFAAEKLKELSALVDYAKNHKKSFLFNEYDSEWEAYQLKNPMQNDIWEKINSIEEKDFRRTEDYATRRPKQMKTIPILPTTSIGSFPQTTQVREVRRLFKTNQISKAEYESFIDKQLGFNIGIQEAIGLDIFVHGEPERTDMVEYFAEKLDGFAFTENGWVQSYGSRCVRPPIIYGDLRRQKDMTVREFKVAQSLTTKPVKGMLTGPVTILNWSFPRIDTSRQFQAYQLALCLREEIAALESNGATVIQVDEPALREGMPLKEERKAEYLRWAVDSFRLCTAVAKPETSIHTHMCYAEFHDCMDAIDSLDADVNSIENARSGDETVREFKKNGYTRDLGPGTYDIHSPVVPSVEDIRGKLESFLAILPAKQIVVNPDCGLKTRNWKETIDALRNMVLATKLVREKLKY